MFKRTVAIYATGRLLLYLAKKKESVEGFVKDDSIVREIWGKSDTILFIFVGAAAEFALNKAVDWLYFTGRLPADPIGRLFSTVQYARMIVFAPKDEAETAIKRITAIHQGVEDARSATIPAWAYRDVLFMLIYYSIAAFELLERKLSEAEKEEVFDVFNRFGHGMGLEGLPGNYAGWRLAHQEHLHRDLVKSDLSIDLFKQYKKHLGPIRYWILLEAQKLVVPTKVKSLLGFSSFAPMAAAIPLYKYSRKIKADRLIRRIILPAKYQQEIDALDVI